MADTGTGNEGLASVVMDAFKGGDTAPMTSTETEIAADDGDVEVEGSDTGVEVEAEQEDNNEDSEQAADTEDAGDSGDEETKDSKPEFEEAIDTSDIELDATQQTKADLRVKGLVKQGFDEGMAKYIAKIEQHNIALRYADTVDSDRVLKQIADVLEMEVPQFIESSDQWAFDVRVEKELEKKDYQNIEPELARKMAVSEIKRIQAERKIETQKTAQDKEALANKAIDDLFAEFPEAMEINPLPKEITHALQNGYSPREAYLKYRLGQQIQQKELEEKAKKGAEAAAKKSPGSSKSQKETNDGDPLKVLSAQLFAKD